MTIYTVKIEAKQAFSNVKGSKWQGETQELWVRASSVEQAMNKAKRFKSKDFKGSFEDEKGKTVRYWVTDIRVLEVTVAGTLDIP